MKVWIIVGVVVIIGLVTFFIVNQGGPGVVSLGPQNSEEANLEVGEGEVIFDGPNSLFKIDWDEVTETDTHYSFSGGLVSSDGGTTWEVFPDKVDLNKIEWTVGGG